MTSSWFDQVVQVNATSFPAAAQQPDPRPVIDDRARQIRPCGCSRRRPRPRRWWSPPPPAGRCGAATPWRRVATRCAWTCATAASWGPAAAGVCCRRAPTRSPLRQRRAVLVCRLRPGHRPPRAARSKSRPGCASRRAFGVRRRTGCRAPSPGTATAPGGGTREQIRESSRRPVRMPRPGSTERWRDAAPICSSTPPCTPPSAPAFPARAPARPRPGG